MCRSLNRDNGNIFLNPHPTSRVWGCIDFYSTRCIGQAYWTSHKERKLYNGHLQRQMTNFSLEFIWLTSAINVTCYERIYLSHFSPVFVFLLIFPTTVSPAAPQTLANYCYV